MYLVQLFRKTPRARTSETVAVVVFRSKIDSSNLRYSMPRRSQPAHLLSPKQKQKSNQTSYSKSKSPSRVRFVKSESECEPEHKGCRVEAVEEFEEGYSYDHENYEDSDEEEDNTSDIDIPRVAVWEADNDFEGELNKASKEVCRLALYRCGIN